MSEVIDAYEACKETKESRLRAEKEEEKQCADLESALKLAYPQYRVLSMVLAKLEDELAETMKSMYNRDHSGLITALSVVRREIERCKKDILEVENIALAGVQTEREKVLDEILEIMAQFPGGYTMVEDTHGNRWSALEYCRQRIEKLRGS
jgi:hypothetical protein